MDPKSDSTKNKLLQKADQQDIALEISKRLQQGDTYMNEGCYQAAINDYSAATAMNPHLPGAYLKRSQAYYYYKIIDHRQAAAYRDCLQALLLDINEPGLREWLSQIVSADFFPSTLVENQLKLFRKLLVERVRPEDEAFTLLAQAMLCRKLQPSELNSSNSKLIHSTGYNLLHIAACIGEQTLAEELIKQGIGVNSVNEANQVSPLMIAACNNQMPLVKYLLAQQANINQANILGQTPLLFAVEEGRLKVVKYLVEQTNADINKLDYFSRTPLFIAAEGGHLAVVQYLVEQKNADINQADKSGHTPLCIAARNGHLEVVQYLVGKIAKVQQEDKHFWIMRALKTLIAGKKETGLNQADKFGQTPLLDAAARGHLEVVKYLVEQGQADVCKTNINKQSCLHLAAKYGHKEICRQLIIYGALQELKKHHPVALCTLQDEQGQTALNLAEPALAASLKKWHDDRFFLANQFRLNQVSTIFTQSRSPGLFAKTQKFADCKIINAAPPLQASFGKNKGGV